ncbi:hypothetical protein ALC62_00141 [Cyphomyrmex costatus]|uniref:Uncharacterized protein n=1 Tax=Cyphomyrmex costatus TaxID=456900 RepID=A0A151K272_9HYME|nr:hypothetical protein ALC62_00141 [Cyphomyrmex costatus]
MEMIPSSKLNFLHRRCDQFVPRNRGCSSSFNSRRGQSIFFYTVV